jgi:type I restriction enzyme S subunit
MDNDKTMELPNSWIEVKLNELATLTLGGDWGKDADFEDSNFATVLCIRGSEFRYWNENKGSTASVRKIKISSLENRKLIEGDILVEISGGGPEQPVGRTVLIDKTVLSFSKEIPKVCTNFLRLLRTTENFDSNFLNLYLTFFYCSGKIRDYQGGSNNLRNLRFNDYLELDIPFPPLLEQHRIVAKIEALFSELDKGIESLKTAQQQLKIYRQALLKHAFSGKYLVCKKIITQKFGRECDSTLRDVILSLGQGWSPRCLETPSESNDLWGVIRTTAIQPLHFDDTKNKQLPAGLNPREHLEISVGDILITRAGPRNRVGISCFVKDTREKLLLCDKAYRLQVNKEKIIPEYLVMLLNASETLKQLEDLKSGISDSGVNLTQDKFLTLKIILPSLEHQKIILDDIEKKLTNVAFLENGIDKTLQQSEVLRQSILKKAFSGQLVPQDPNDEPASVLLERIKAENAALINPVKTITKKIKSGKKTV